MTKHTPDQRLVGLAWFDRKQWNRLIEAAEDRSELDETYEQWQQRALEAVQAIEQQGQQVERVHVETQSLVSWCKEKKLPVNAKSSAQYVTELMQRRHGRAKPRF
jgi:2-methylcitrate dehydratase PrpD